jgi:hypothetical protein
MTDFTPIHFYDRAPQDADRRKGQWFLYREMQEG